VKVAFGTETDTQVVSALARDLRSGERLMVEANQGWDIAEARRAVPHLGAFGLGFIEEPIPADRPVHEWAELAMLSPVPLAGGENVRRSASSIASREFVSAKPVWAGIPRRISTATRIAAAMAIPIAITITYAGCIHPPNCFMAHFRTPAGAQQNS
jgi:L-alanine-DL-glutamate epimerase-like enolase superfamily enzyme